VILDDVPGVRFFPCSWTARVRWALIDSPTDDLGLVATHGAGENLAAAKRHALESLAHRKELSKL
jgi:hypothetical protein